MAKRKKFPYWMTLATILLAGTASWALYGLINKIISDLLKAIGIVNDYIQSIVVVIIILIFLLIAGYSAKKAINKIVGN